MEKEVLSIKQMEYLQELELNTSNASMCWVKLGENTILSIHDEHCYESSLMEAIPTFTLQDILEILPFRIKDNLDNCYYITIEQLSTSRERIWTISYRSLSNSIIKVETTDRNIIIAAYNILCWCIENGYINKS